MSADVEIDPTDRWRTSVHEAGHAVVGRVLRMVCGPATSLPDHDSAGHHVVKEHWATLEAWWAREIYRERTSAIHGRIMTYFAGAEAEKELLDILPTGDGDDIYQAELMVNFELDIEGEEAARKLSRLRRQTRRVVRRHRELIAEVAKRLTVCDQVTGEELDSMVAGPLNLKPVSISRPYSTDSP